ncbi:MAG: chemotaxis protein CheC [Syntrophomonadaceae bacterium]
MVYISNLSSMQLDALREIGNIGAGNAATAMAELIKAKIDMNVPNVKILPFGDVPDLLGGADCHIIGIYLDVGGSVSSNILFILPIEQACLLVDLLMGKEVGESKADNLGEIELSAMREMGNIIAATYLNALAAFTGLTLRPSVPALAIDMAGAVLDAVLARFGEVADHVLLLETCFKKDVHNVVGHFLLLPEPEALDTILSALGVSN